MNEIIVGVDGSATARLAAEEAVALANAYNRPLHIVTSMSRTSSQEVQGGGSERWTIDSVGVAENMLRALAGELKAQVPVTFAVLRDDPAVGLVDEATRLDASTIVVGNRRVQGAARVLGSIAGDVAKRAPCNVLIVNTHK